MPADATCKTCPFWTRRTQIKWEPDPVTGDPVSAGKEPSEIGACHHSCNGSEQDPARNENWWCSEHPLRQRDRLAAMAMAAYAGDPSTRDWTKKETATSAYRLADAMLAEAAKGADCAS